MAKKTSSSEALAASNAATGSPMNRRMKHRDDLAATQPSDEVMNALFEQVAVRLSTANTSLHYSSQRDQNMSSKQLAEWQGKSKEKKWQLILEQVSLRLAHMIH